MMTAPPAETAPKALTAGPANEGGDMDVEQIGSLSITLGVISMTGDLLDWPGPISATVADALQQAAVLAGVTVCMQPHPHKPEWWQIHARTSTRLAELDGR